MAWKPMEPAERASIEAQVCLKAGVELAIAEIAQGDEGVAVTNAIQNAEALALALPSIQTTLLNGRSQEVVQAAEEAVKTAFPGATTVSEPAGSPTMNQRVSQYIDDGDYSLVHKIFMQEEAASIEYAGQDSMFMDNQAIRKLFQTGTREFPEDYWAESMRGKPIPITKNGKCGLGDFKIKKGTSLDENGNPFLMKGDGNHPLANKSGYYGALVKHTGFNWADRPAPKDPNQWLAKVDG